MDYYAKFVEYRDKSLKGYTLVEGFPGMGLVGTIAAKYLIDRRKLKQIGHIESNIFLPVIRIHEGRPVYPARVYIFEEKKIVVLIAEQIIPRMLTSIFADAVVGWIKKKGISRIISLEGIKAEPGKNVVYGIAANEHSKKILKKNKVDLIQDGITTGLTSLILLSLGRAKMEACSILGNVNVAADYKAAAALIEKLNEMAGLKLDVKPLLKEAKETEKQLIEQLQQLKKTDQNASKLEQKVPMYT